MGAKEVVLQLTPMQGKAPKPGLMGSHRTTSEQWVSEGSSSRDCRWAGFTWVRLSHHGSPDSDTSVAGSTPGKKLLHQVPEVPPLPDRDEVAKTVGLNTLSGREGESKRSYLGTTGYLQDGQIVVLAIELLLYLAKVWIRQRRKVGSVAIVQSLSRVWLFETPWTAARQAPLSSTITQNLLRFMSIESVMLSNHLILCLPLLPSIFPSIRVFRWVGSSHQVAKVLELQLQY